MENNQTQSVATSGKIKFPIGAIFLILLALRDFSSILGDTYWFNHIILFLIDIISCILLITLAVLLLMKKRNNVLLIPIGGLVLCGVLQLFISFLYSHMFSKLVSIAVILIWVAIGLFLLMNINEKFASLKDKKKIFDIVFIVLVVLYAVGGWFSVPEIDRDDIDMVRCLFPVILYVLSFIFVKSWIVNPYVKERNNDNSDVVNSEQYISLGKHIALLLFTCGVWQMIWIYKVTGYTNSAKNHKQRTPSTALLLNLFVPFYSIYWTFQTAKKIDTLAQEKKIQSDLGTVCLILSIFVPFVPPILMQDKVNQIVSGTGTVIPAAVSDAESIEKYKELFDKGVITEEEFNAKKKQLLGL